MNATPTNRPDAITRAAVRSAKQPGNSTPPARPAVSRTNGTSRAKTGSSSPSDSAAVSRSLGRFVAPARARAAVAAGCGRTGLDIALAFLRSQATRRLSHGQPGRIRV